MTIDSRAGLKPPSLALLRRSAWAPVAYDGLSETDKKRVRGLVARELVELRGWWVYATPIGREILT